MVEARDRIVQEALSCLGGEAVRLREEEDLARRRLSQVRADIGRLVEVLKSLGARGLASVQSELERLEDEEGQMKKNLTEIAKHLSSGSAMMPARFWKHGRTSGNCWSQRLRRSGCKSSSTTSRSSNLG